MENPLVADKQQERFDRWLAAPGVEWADSEAAANYRARVQRIIDAVQLREPDQVPVLPNVGFFPAYYSGISFETAMHDYPKMAAAMEKYVLDFEPDTNPGAFGPRPGTARAFEPLDYKLFRFPGHGLSADTPFQCVEAEYMKADEYDEFTCDPSGFMNRKYLGRICGKLEGLAKLPLPFVSTEYGGLLFGLTAYGDPKVQEALQALMAAGQEAARWAAVSRATDNKLVSLGFPKFEGGVTKVPFDLLADTLRGTIPIMKDMYRQPQKILAAVERLVPMMIEWAVSSARYNLSPLILIFLHKGDDMFMSAEHYQKFYWPTLKAVVMGLIEEGLVPILFAQGRYNTRLDIIQDLPAGKVVWYFDNTDMAKAKEALGGKACLMGNVPGSLLATAAKEDVTACCKTLIDTAGKGGGYIMSSGAVIDAAKPENVMAMMETARTYGRYRS